MIQTAREWTLMPSRQLGFSSGNVRVTHGIASNGDPTCVSHKFTRSGITFVEHVVLRISLRHPRRGQVRIRLKSPEDVVSVFSEAHPDHHANYPSTG